jgi:hypothetical protein
VLAELAAKRHSIRDASRMLMDEDHRVEGNVVPPDVPLHYVLAILRGNVSPTLGDYSDLALTFSPKRYAENPHCFAGSNYEIFSNPAKVSAALAMFAATFGPLERPASRRGRNPSRRACRSQKGRPQAWSCCGGPRDPSLRGSPRRRRCRTLRSRNRRRLNAKFESQFDGPAFTEAAARLASAHTNYDAMERFFQTANYGAPPTMAPLPFSAPPSYAPPDAPMGSLASPFGAQLAPAAPFYTAAWGAGAPPPGPSSAFLPAAPPASSPSALLHSSGAPMPSSGSRVARLSSRVAAQAATAPKRLTVAVKLPDGAPFVERMVFKGENIVRVGIFGYTAEVYETHSVGCPAPFVIWLATGVKVLPDQLATFRQGLCTVVGEAHAHGASSAHRGPPEKLVELASVRFEVPDGGWAELPNVPKSSYFGGPRRGP